MLDPAFLRAPLAHRALHDVTRGRPENSRAAIRAAIAAGYGIEIDLQLSADGQAMVFHDYSLDRLTGARGALRTRSAAELSGIALRHGDEGIPGFREVLGLVAGQVPLLVELKDQDGAMGADVGPLERAAADAARDYPGALAFMSFNPHSVACMGELAPGTARGLVSDHFAADDWPLLPETTRRRLRAIPDYDRVGACFISHNAADLQSPRVGALKAAGAAVLCWTVRTPKEEAVARRIADNVTFEGYRAEIAA